MHAIMAEDLHRRGSESSRHKAVTESTQKWIPRDQGFTHSNLIHNATAQVAWSLDSFSVVQVHRHLTEQMT